MAIPEKPISRIEHYLARANGQNVQPPDPISRIEHYLAGIAGGVPQELLDDVAELKSQMDEKAPAIMQTVSDQSVVSFADGADDMPLKSLVVTINPVQAGTGDPSPENVRPISGWTGAKVTRTGKNLLPTDFLPQTIKGITVTVGGDGSVTLNGTATETFTITTQTNGSFIWDGTTSCWLSGCPAGGDYKNGYSLRADGVRFGYSNAETGDGIALQSFSSQNSIVGQSLKFAIVIRGGTVCNNVTFKPMLNVGTSALPFEPYQSDTYNISFLTEAGTVYGGTLDVVSGELTVTMAAVDASSIAWSKDITQVNPNGTYYIAVIEIPFIGWGNGGVDTAISNALVKASESGKASTENANTFWWNTARTGYRCIWGAPSGGSTIKEFLSFIQQNNVVFVGKLAQPITITLTPQTLTTVLGQNNIFADTGNVTVIYPADTKTYIDDKIAALQALVLENISNS